MEPLKAVPPNGQGPPEDPLGADPPAMGRGPSGGKADAGRGGEGEAKGREGCESPSSLRK